MPRPAQTSTTTAPAKTATRRWSARASPSRRASKWLINLQGQYLDADWGDFGDYEGSISRANALVEYRFTENFGVFVGYDWFKLDATSGSDGSLGLDQRFKGPIAGVTLRPVLTATLL